MFRHLSLFIAENIVKTQVAQDLGLLSRRGVERILRGEETLKDALERRQRRQLRRHESTSVVETKPVVKTYKAGKCWLTLDIFSLDH